MGRIKDLTNQKFGRLTVLEDVGRTKRQQVIWRCQCECGNTVEVVTGSLRNGDTKSCGCLRNEKTSQRRYIDLTQQVFGRLTVLEDVGRKNGKVLWRCQCTCGNIVDVASTHLQSGATQSCGCYNKERVSETQYKDLTGQIFGRLTVLEDVGRSGRNVLWKCLCDCGNLVNVPSNSLQKGDTQSCGCLHKELISEANSGDKHRNWKGGVTPLRKAIRACTKYCEWRALIFQRDNFTCSHCGLRSGNLISHHIKLFSTIIEEHNITTLEEAIQCEALWDVSNGLTLCKRCHKREHARLKVLTSQVGLSIFLS